MTDPNARPAATPSSSAGAPGTAGAAGSPGSPTRQKHNVSVGQILGGILLVLIIIFIVENTDNVKIRIIAGPKVDAPIFVALLIAAVVGALISALLRFRRQHHAKNK